MGKRYQYELGQYLYRRYGEITGKYYNESNVYIHSTEVERAMMSALCNAAGYFPPSGFQVWDNSLEWQPIPVHTIPLQDDYLLYQSNACASIDNVHSALVESNQTSAFLHRYNGLIKYIENNTGLTSNSNSDIFKNIYTVYDALKVENERGLM